RATEAEQLGRLLGGDRGAGQGGAEQVMAAAVAARDAVRARLPARHWIIAEPGQGVVFGQEADRRPRATGPLSHERGRHTSRTAPDREARRFKFTLVHLRRCLLPQTQLGQLPDLGRHPLDDPPNGPRRTLEAHIYLRPVHQTPGTVIASIDAET